MIDIKKLVTIIIPLIIVLFLSYFIGSGFTKNNNVVLHSFSVSEDGKTLTFETNILSSIGYTRGFKDSGGCVKPHYLTFYNTFGGINSPIGAKNKFTLELSDTDTEIYFNLAGGGYARMLKKDESGVWQRP